MWEVSEVHVFKDTTKAENILEALEMAFVRRKAKKTPIMNDETGIPHTKRWFITSATYSFVLLYRHEINFCKTEVS